MERPKDEPARLRDRISELERMVEGLKGTTKALVESEEETWLLFDEAPLAYHSLDSQGRILKVNHAWMDVLGYARGDVIGKWFGDLLGPEDQRHFKKRFEQFKREGTVHDVEFEVRCKDGSHLSVSFDGRLAYDENGRFRHTHCIMRDVSARKRAEERAAAEQAKLARALECSADLIVVVDLKGKLKMANQAYVEATGYTAHELIGKDFAHILVPDHVPDAWEVFHKDVMRHGSISGRMMNVVTKDGNLLNLMGSATVMCDENGEPAEVLLIGKDMTESIRTQEALRESEDRLRALFGSSPESITILGLDGTILARNKATEEISGLPSSDLIGKTFGELGVVLEDDFAEDGVMLARLKSGEKLGPVEGTIVRKDGEMRWIEIFASPLKKDDETYAIQAITRDITERKRLGILSTVLRDLGLALSTISDLREGLRLCLDAALKVSDMDCGGIYLVDQASGALELAFHQGLSPEFIQAVSHFKPGAANFKLVMAGKPVYTEHARLGVPLGRAQAAAGLRAIAVLPITREGRVIGCINVASHTVEQVPGWSRESLETVATAIGNAITRLRAETALGVSENRFRSLTEHAPDYIVQLDREGRILFTNRLYDGVSMDDIIGTSVFAWIPAEYHLRFEEALEVAFDTGKPQIVDYSAVDPKGRKIWYSANMGPVSDESGVTGSAILVIRDLTERRTAEKALQEREARFRGVFDNASHGMVLVGRDGRLILANDRSHTMLGYEPGELVGNAVMEHTHPDDLEMSRANLKMLIEGKLDGYRVEKRYLRKDGALIWVDLSVRPLRSNGGEIESILGILVDITERKRAEEALRRGEEQIRRYSEDLEDMVRERTARIHELEHQRAESEKLAATGRMAARIAHEINNPLGGIKNSFLLLKDIMDKNHPHYAYAGRVEGEIDRIAGIVRRMFDFYKPGRAGDTEVSISKTITDVVAILESTSRAAEVTLSLDAPEDPITATLPGGYVDQIMYNLIRNAIEASQPGNAVEVSAAVEGDTAVIRVRDEGPGIPEEIADRVFEPFFTTKDRTGVNGLGLGLSVSRGMAEMMGGSIAFDSASDTGTTFTVSLPIGKQTEEV
ncbi:MAG: PAS domain S-box protein [Candidatus Eisenbacteria bacterium]